jgi:drug/metabolite transporter (DMT)-like permease
MNSSTTNRPLAAALLVLGAMMLFGLIDNFVRLAAEEGGVWQFHFLRSVVALMVLLPLAWMRGIALWPKRPRNVLARSVLTSIAMVIYFACLGFMPIAQVVAGLFTAPIFVVLFSVLLFKERIGPRRIFAVGLGFVGATLALRPDAADLSIWTIVPVMAGAVYALGNIATRRWCEGEGTLTLLGAFFGCMLVWGGLGLVFLAVYPLPVPAGGDGFITRGWVWPGGIFGLMILIQGVGSLIGVGATIRAYQLAEATMVAVFENLLLVFATIWAIFLWGEVPDTLGIIGLAMITVAGVIIALRSDVPTPMRAAGHVE